jgi:hypothetical protein
MGSLSGYQDYTREQADLARAGIGYNMNERLKRINLNKQINAARGPLPPRPKKLPNKNISSMRHLEQIVGNLQRDIKFIKDTQSKQGAENWIVKHGYDGLLSVDDRDIDGDDIPDIIVRDSVTGDPYIVKGYTTTDSDYPLRYRYFSQYPTRESRKDHAYRNWVNENTFEYDDSGMKRIFNPDMVQYIEKANKHGYNIKLPRENVGGVTAYNKYILKPVLKVIKSTAQAMGVPLNLDPVYVRQTEKIIRMNMIDYPILVTFAQNENILQEDPETIQKLLNDKDVKMLIKTAITELIQKRDTIFDDVIKAFVIKLFVDGRLNFGPNPATGIDMEFADSVIEHFRNPRA